MKWLLIPIALVFGAATILLVGPRGGAGQINARSTTAPIIVAAQHEVEDGNPAPAPLRPQPPSRGLLDKLADTFAPASRNPPASAPAQPPAQIPALPYRYAGQVESDGKKLVLLMRDQVTLIAGAGDILEGVYRVDQILPQGARLTYLPFNVSQHALAAGPGPGQPIGLMLTGPAQAERGGVFQIDVGLSGGNAAQSAQLHVSYDPESFQMLDVGAGGGPALPVLSSSPGIINLGFNNPEQAQAAGSTPIRFLVIGGQPGSAEIALAVDAKDGNGRPIATTPPERRIVMMQD